MILNDISQEGALGGALYQPSVTWKLEQKLQSGSEVSFEQGGSSDLIHIWFLFKICFYIYRSFYGVDDYGNSRRNVERN